MPDTQETTVYGDSDDLIELRGAITEEFGTYGGVTDESLLAFDTGVVLRIHYTDIGVWRITPVAGDTSTVTITQAPEDNDNYSDRAVVVGATWCVFGSAIAKAVTA